MKIMIKLLFVFCFLFFQFVLSQDDTLTHQAQDPYLEEFVDTNLITHTFESTRVINGHSIETLRKGVLEFRIEHRFGDVVGAEGGIGTLYGLDNSSDIRIAFEYGINNRLMVGAGRSKGTGNPFRSLLDGFVKYKLVNQSKVGSPISITAIGSTSFSYMKKSTDLSQLSSFPMWQHRFAYVSQISIAKKLGDRFSVSLTPTLVHRNFVSITDVNTFFSLGGGASIPIAKKWAVLLEYYHNFSNNGFRKEFSNSLGIALEWVTFGHVFTINLTNSKGFGETQFIPYTFEKWNKGQFRLGFCISRKYEKE
jgi:hypothetical protein